MGMRNRILEWEPVMNRREVLKTGIGRSPPLRRVDR